MFNNLKKSEKILLGVLGVSIIFLIIFNLILPTFTKINDLDEKIIDLNSELTELEQTGKINGSDNSVSAREKEADNILLSYKNDYYIENFSQDYLITKLNDFTIDTTNEDSEFSILQALFTIIEIPETETESTTETSDDDLEDDIEKLENDADSTSTSNTDENSDDTTTDDEADTEDETASEDEKPEIPTTIAEIDPATLNEDVAQYFGISLDFVANYDGLINYVKNIENFSDALLITSLTITPVVANNAIAEFPSDDTTSSASSSGFTYVANDGFVKSVPDELFTQKGMIKGNMQIIFVDLKIYDDGNDFEYSNPIFDEEDDLTIVENPFRPFDDFTHYQEPAPVENDTTGNNNSNNGGNSSFIEMPSLVYKTIYGFENDQFFFTSSPSSTKGTANSSPISYSGDKSGKLTYNFVKGVENSTASFVFDNNSILITEEPTSVALKVYELTPLPYELGITVKDSTGELYDVILPKNTDSTELWSTYEGPLPDITYPCIVKRVFVTTNGAEKTQLQGELLLDQLEVSKKAN